MTFEIRHIGLAAAVPVTLACAAPALAQTDQAIVDQVQALRREVDAQRQLLEQQQARIDAQGEEIEQLKAARSADTAILSSLRGLGIDDKVTGGAPMQSASAAAAQVQPVQPVGEAPADEDIRDRPAVGAVPVNLGVLTPKGHIVFDPQLEYVGDTSNRLVFRGIELIPGLQIGAIEASDVDRDTIIATGAVRYGISSRLEAEIRVPYLYRHDRIEVVQQREASIVRTINLNENKIGDVEFALRYQLNNPKPLRPIWIAQMRVKTPTGQGPFDVGFDEFGVATGLATGSGFWSVQPGISFLLPSDPIVIYGGASYSWNIPGNVNKVVGEVPVGRVDPGDSIGVNVGFGFAINPQFSFSLGYRHIYIFPTDSELGPTVQRSARANIGSLQMGMSYRITQKQMINLGFTYGVTDDAPDVGISVRVPFETSLR